MDGDNWHCYHHSILCGATKESLQQEVKELRLSIALDLEAGHVTHKFSVHFEPSNDDDRDEFMDL
jgi:hypothetical protein